MQMTTVLMNVPIFCSIIIAMTNARLVIDPTCASHRGTKCVDVYKCPYFSLLLKNSRKNKLQVITEIRRKQCGFMNRNPAVCCTTKKESESRQIEITRRNSDLLPNDKCGPVTLTSRITNGKRTNLNEYPWMALIVYDTENGLEFSCGGSLISEKYVLTAAHCILKTIIGVRLGEYDVLSIEDCDGSNNYCAPPVQDFHIEKVIVHAGYKGNAKDDHDIALIRLSNAADISSENVQPICLPLEHFDLEGKLFTVAGWGMTETGYKSSVLKRASVPVIPMPICQRIYEGQANLTQNQLCAGGDKADSCNGDSGGPLTSIIFVNGLPKHVQHGIVSYGPKACGTLGMPGIYTRVEPYIVWILDSLEP